MQVSSPLGMTTLSTHDTKRGEDTRSRLGVLSELPREWSRARRPAPGRHARPTAARCSTAGPSTCCGRRSPARGPTQGPISEDRLVALPDQGDPRGRSPAPRGPRRTSRTSAPCSTPPGRRWWTRQVARPVHRVGGADAAGRAGRDPRHQAGPADAARRRRRLPGHRGPEPRARRSRTTVGPSTSARWPPGSSGSTTAPVRATWPTRSCSSRPARCACGTTCPRRSSVRRPGSCRWRTRRATR